MKEQIVSFLKKSDGYLSGEEISRSLNISRAAIWKYMQELRALGYSIDAVPHQGYRLLSSPDKLLPWELEYDLGTAVLGRKAVCHDMVESTMDEAFHLGVEGAEEGVVVCADGQRKGRGRLGRTWISSKGKGAYFSVLLRPALHPNEVSQLTLLCAVAVSEGLEGLTGLQPRIKWPNDLLLNNRKFGGILTEMSADTDRVKFVVAGFGINVLNGNRRLPAEATSLKTESGRTFLRTDVIRSILRSLDGWYARLKTEGFAPAISRWKDLSTTLGQRVKITDPRGTEEGVAVDLAEDGGLLIRNGEGRIVKKMSGDVSA